MVFPKCHVMSQWNSSDTHSTRRRHVGCRSHDLSSLSHHLLVSTYVSPVGAITVVRRPDDVAWLQKTKRHQSSRVCCGVTVASMSRSWRDWGLVLLPAARRRHRRRQRISEVVNYWPRLTGWCLRYWGDVSVWESDTSNIHPFTLAAGLCFQMHNICTVQPVSFTQ